MFGKKNKEMSLEKVSELLSGVATPLSLYLVPTNLDSERKKFFGSSSYNPQFKYRRPKAVSKNNGIFDKLSGLESVKGVDPEISKFIVEVVKHKKQASGLLDAIGDDSRFVEISKQRFGIPTYLLFKKACKILRRRYGDLNLAPRDAKLREKKLKYDDLVPVFEEVFKALGLEEWTLDKSKAIIRSGFRTAVKTKRIMVDPNISVSAERLRKTIIHEVATHALRGNNGFGTGYEVFGKPNLAECLDDEEGLALFNEEKFGVLRKTDIKKRAAYVYALHLGKSHSFRDVFDALRSSYARMSAFDVAYRIKRGISDTSKPGCYFKDVVYLRGFLKVRERLAGDEVSYANMYAGKIPLSHLYLVEEGVIPKPRVVPQKDIFEKVFKKAGLI
ncbi:DUF1704 domain-containing protein [Candidatus Dojkabacteria bacterium]|nr:DUF1704 domain-containing protein [Candidatus Dojkabacteria bacterium]